jgi:hypothetical protein
MRLSRALMLGFALCCLATPIVAAEKLEGLAAIAAEPRLERRARDALSYARKSVGSAVKAYRAGDVAGGERHLKEIQEAIELAKESLDATGKDPRRRSGPFKNLEIGTRRLLGELREIEKEMNYDERDVLVAVQNRVEEINHDLVMGIMSKKK